MVPPTRPKRSVKHRPVLTLMSVLPLLLLSPAALRSQPKPVQVEFLPLGVTACAVTSPDSNFLVSVFVGSSEFSTTRYLEGTDRIDLVFAGQDKVTRLCFFQNPKPEAAQSGLWRERFEGEKGGGGDALRAITPARAIDCKFDRWVTQVGDKVLPLGLLLINFQEAVPPAGTPLADPEGRIVGLILQPASGGSAYAIPAQAVHRVCGDITRHRKFLRGWLGISLSTESQIPRITRVWPDSPAAKEGLRENDVLVRASGYSTERYPDAVNALFYTIPGEETSLEILRDNRHLPIKITPISRKPE
jgi:hypothetical protein